MRAKFRMVRVSPYTEFVKVLVLEFACLSLQLRSIALPQWIMEKILSSYEGNVKVHPSVFLALSTVRVKILKPRSPSIFTSWVAVVSSYCFIRSSMASNISRVSLKGLPLPTHTSKL